MLIVRTKWLLIIFVFLVFSTVILFINSSDYYYTQIYHKDILLAEKNIATGFETNRGLINVKENISMTPLTVTSVTSKTTELTNPQKTTSTSAVPQRSESTTTSTSSTTKKVIVIPKPSPFECYKNPGNLSTVPNIRTRTPKIGKHIVFLETTCQSRSKGKLFLTPRQACSVESAALRNPDFEVHLMFTSPAVIKQSNDTSDKMMVELTKYKNIIISRIDIDDYFKGTPVEELYRSGLMETSRSPAIHLSDVLRSVTMWKYGSIYLDLDVISLRSFDDIEPNFTGIEYGSSIAAGVLHFNATGKGHEMIEMLLKDVNVNFDPKGWSANANGAITKLLKKVCDTKHVHLMTPERCQGFHIHKIPVFYPLGPWNTEDFFNQTNIRTGLGLLQNARTVHMWNAMTSGRLVKKGDNSAFEIMFMQNCPKIYAEMPNEIKFR